MVFSPDDVGADHQVPPSKSNSADLIRRTFEGMANGIDLTFSARSLKMPSTAQCFAFISRVSHTWPGATF